MNPANLGKRVGAYIIDTIITIILSIIPLIFFTTGSAATLGGKLVITWTGIFIFYLANFSLFALLLKFYSTSPGKVAFGLRVINKNGNMLKLSWAQAILRPILTVIFSFFLSFIPQSVAFFRRDRKQVVDLILKTQVAEIKNENPYRKIRFIWGTVFALLSIIGTISNFQNMKQFSTTKDGIEIKVPELPAQRLGR